MNQGEKKESSSSSSSFSRWIDLETPEGCCFFLDLSVDQVPATERIVIQLTMGDTWSSNYASYMVKKGKEKPHVSPAKVFNYGDFICSKRDQLDFLRRGLVDAAAADFGQQCGYQSKAYIYPKITDGVGFNIVFDHMDFLNCRVPVDGSVLQGNETLYKIQPHHRVVITDCGVIPKYQLNNFLTKPAQVFPFYQIFWSLQHGDHQDSIWDKFYSDSEKLVLAEKDSKWGLCTNPVNSEADEGLKKKNHPESDKGIGFCLSDKGLKKNKYPYYSEPDKGLKKNKYPYYSEPDKGLKKNKYPYYSESDKGLKKNKYPYYSESDKGLKKNKYPYYSESDKGLKKNKYPYYSESDKGLKKNKYPYYSESDKGLNKNKYPYYSESDKGLHKNKYPYYSESDKGLKKNKYPCYSESDKGLKKNKYPYYSESDKGQKISNVKRRQYRFCYDSGEGKKKQKTGEK